jgi:DNA repair exonuclease SbcCD nuclease subunit
MREDIIACFLHTADLHLGKTYRTAADENECYEDFFCMLGGIVADAISEGVDFVLIAGDLFHTGQILPRTFARTIEILQSLKDAGIPCIAVEGNYGWIHRRTASLGWKLCRKWGISICSAPPARKPAVTVLTHSIRKREWVGVSRSRD